MCLFRLFILLLALTSTLSLVEEDSEYRVQLKNLFKRSSKDRSQQKKYPRSSILEVHLNKTSNRTKDLIEYVEHIKRRGLMILANKDIQIMKIMKLKKSISEISVVTSEYAKQVQMYYDKTVGQKKDMVYSEGIILYDLVEMACRLLYQKQMAIVNTTFTALSTQMNEPLKATSWSLMEAIKQESADLKSQEFHNICIKYKVCRRYPAFTDHCGYFLTEVLNLPKNKLTVFYKVLSMIVSHNEEFQEMVIKLKKDKDVVQEVLKKVSKAPNMKEHLELLKDALCQKFNIIYMPNITDKIKAASLRILLNTVDELFEQEDYKSLLLHLDTTIMNMKKWVKDKIPSISIILLNFISQLFKLVYKVINAYTDTMKKIDNLIEILVGDNKIVHEDYYKTIRTQRNEL